MRIKRTLLLATAPIMLTALLTPSAMSDDVPPTGSKPFSAMRKSIESDKAVVEFVDCYWEFELDLDGKEIEFDIDRVTGKRRGA